MSETPPPRRYDHLAPRAPDGPFSLSEWFPGTGDLELDIGFGRGNSLFERGAIAPGSRIVGFEIKTKWAYLVSEGLNAKGYDHVRVLCGDVREILSRTTDAETVARASVHFPDPWWKQRHTKRRVVADVLLDALARLMPPGGELFVQTDVEDRARLYRDTIAEHSAFVFGPTELEGEPGFIGRNPFGARSNRERRAEEDGLPIYRMLAKRDG